MHLTGTGIYESAPQVSVDLACNGVLLVIILVYESRYTYNGSLYSIVRDECTCLVSFFLGSFRENILDKLIDIQQIRNLFVSLSIVIIYGLANFPVRMIMRVAGVRMTILGISTVDNLVYTELDPEIIQFPHIVFIMSGLRWIFSYNRPTLAERSPDIP